MKKYLLILLLFIAYYSNAQYTQIPDICFESILIEIGIDTEGTLDGQVLTEDIANVVSLDLGGFFCDVLDASGIEDFTNLEFLFIGRSINNIDLSNNLQLKEVTALQGDLQNINIVNCTELTSLTIIDNQLINIDLSSNINLEYLDLSSNNFTNVDLSNNSNLLEFYVYNNNLTELNINNLTNLEELHCQNNLITNLNISDLINLTRVVANNNLINTIIFNNLPSLTGFGLANNNISQVNLSDITNLVSFNLNNNQLVNLDVTSNVMLDRIRCANNSLNTLDLSQNYLLDFISVEDNLLTTLDIRNNNNGIVTTFNTTNNPNLTCIFVDHIDYSTTNWLDIDPNSTFVETAAECEALDINDFTLNNISIYPNPTKGILFIDNPNTINIEFIKIYNMLGQQVLIKNGNFNQINLTTLKPAMYLVAIKTNKGIINTKIIKK